jgi:hypothetical protein
MVGGGAVATATADAPFRPLPLGPINGELGWLSALGTRGVHRPLSDPSTDLQVRFTADGQPANGVTGDPVLIQSTFGSRGNFELYVPQGNIIRHYFRNNDDPQLAWHQGGDSLSYFRPPNQRGSTPRNVTFIQSNFLGDGVHGNFEAIVRVAPPIATESDHLDFWFLNTKVGKWNGPFGLTADGQPVNGVTGF